MVDRAANGRPFGYAALICAGETVNDFTLLSTDMVLTIVTSDSVDGCFACCGSKSPSTSESESLALEFEAIKIGNVN